MAIFQRLQILKVSITSFGQWHDQMLKYVMFAGQSSISIPGAFPVSPPTSPPSSPRRFPSSPVLAPSDHDQHAAPVEKILDSTPTGSRQSYMPEVYPDLVPYWRTRRSPRPSLSAPQTPAHLVTPTRKKKAQKDARRFNDPYEARSLEYEKYPFGRPVSAVSLVSPLKPPIPHGRSASILEPEYERREREKLAMGLEDGRPPRIILKGDCVRQLSQNWLNRVSMALKTAGPVAASLSGDELYAKDITTCTRQLAWLNDAIINSYLALLIQYLRAVNGNAGPSDQPKYHAFNSFFYSNLRDKGYDAVRRWAKRAKIGGEVLLNVDTVFVPVHESSHWTLMVVRPIDRTIEYFDSLGARGARQVNTIKTWLHGELGEKFVDDEWTFLPSESSHQDNGSDCGVFLLTNAKAIALNIKPTSFGADHTRLLRLKIVAEIMNGGLTGDFNPTGMNGEVLL